MACFNLLSQSSGRTGSCDGHSKLQYPDSHYCSNGELSLRSERSRKYLENIIWKLPQKKTKVFVPAGRDHLRTKIIINDETLEQ